MSETRSSWNFRRKLTSKQEWIHAELESFRIENTAPGDYPADIANVIATIHENPFDPELSVKKLRQKHDIRNNNFGTRFCQRVGLGMREYIEELRLAAASQLLRNDELEIYLIAMAVGYSHPETFCRAFQRCRGRSPMEERQVRTEAEMTETPES